MHSGKFQRSMEKFERDAEETTSSPLWAVRSYKPKINRYGMAAVLKGVYDWLVGLFYFLFFK